MNRILLGWRDDTADSLSLPKPTDPDLAAVDRANQALARLKASYATEWAPAALADMRSLIADLTGDPGHIADIHDQIYRLAHDMKGQGATFGYTLLTQIGDSLCRVTADRGRDEELRTTVLRAHVDAAQRVLDEDLAGTGGEAGERLMKELTELTASAGH